MAKPEPARPLLLRDQVRARYAYSAVTRTAEQDRDDYLNAVNDFAVTALRSGLCAAIAGAQRNQKGGKLLLEDLAQAQLIDFGNSRPADLADFIRKLDVDSYIVATREFLQVAQWLKRALQAP